MSTTLGIVFPLPRDPARGEPDGSDKRRRDGGTRATGGVATDASGSARIGIGVDRNTGRSIADDGIVSEGRGRATALERPDDGGLTDGGDEIFAAIGLGDTGGDAADGDRTTDGGRAGALMDEISAAAARGDTTGDAGGSRAADDGRARDEISAATGRGDDADGGRARDENSAAAARGDTDGDAVGPPVTN